MELIKKYKHHPNPIDGVLPTPSVPMTIDVDQPVYYFFPYLNALTLAVESGKVDREHWPTQLFASLADFDSFMEQLGAYPEHLTDRWCYALGKLAPDVRGHLLPVDFAEALLTATHAGPDFTPTTWSNT